MSRTLDTAMHLHSAALRLLRAVRVADAETGVSAPKLSALSVLTFGGPMSLSALAKAEQVRAPTMSKLVADLEAEGLVVKRADKADKRGVRIEATAKGRALMEEGRKKRLALLSKRLTRLSAAERAELHKAADLMLRLAASDDRA
ncbi:MarR family winged helix-turn-helix transcriptional regulator [Vitreimonas flagellata]|uniref:MarR family winged helix-turn-helix transcriptional regulator n=1 Tax=Vitreimonas flagellata TaxID=2560861 RepID=UPI001074FA21|nr:MarR family transcriptional regulator [Vitreimonas flagellata]